MDKMKPVDSELGNALFDLGKKFILEEHSIRETKIPIWKMYEYYWRGYQNIVWSRSIQDYVGAGLNVNAPGADELSAAFYDKVANIYRAHGESIIAALSNGDLSIQYFPEDAENPLDVETSAAYSKIEEKIKKDVNAELVLIRALYILYTSDFVAAYNYTEEDEKYGTYQVPKLEDKVKRSKNLSCPECGNSDEVSEDYMSSEMVCPSCGAEGMPDESEVIETIYQEAVGYDTKNKIQTCIKVFGPLNVTIPHYASEQSEIPYLRYSFESHYTRMRAMYPHIADKITPGVNDDHYDVLGRQPAEYHSQAQGLVTVNCYWFRPFAFYGLEPTARNKALKDYPDGAYVVFVGRELAEIKNESLDAHWTITENPLASNLHADPLGKPLIDMQDMTNDLMNLTYQTIEHGIPQTFVENEVIDLEKYSNIEVAPGQLIPVEPKPGKSIRDSFETVSTAALSKEVKEFSNFLEQTGQFVVGSFPSIYGGLVGGSRTASEYAQSRNQALQRLSLTWKMLRLWWTKVMTNSIVDFASNLKYDIKEVNRIGDSFVNAFIRKSSLSGSIGRVLPEAGESFPLTWNQKSDMMKEMIASGNEQILSVLFAPENSDQVARILGFPDLYIPGQHDRSRQTWEIAKLISAQPTEGVDETGNPSYEPTVPIEPELDYDMIHIQVCKTFLLGPRGTILKEENPGGYMNVIAHMKKHEESLAMKTMQQHEQTNEGQPPNSSTDTTAV